MFLTSHATYLRSNEEYIFLDVQSGKVGSYRLQEIFCARRGEPPDLFVLTNGDTSFCKECLADREETKAAKAHETLE